MTVKLLLKYVSIVDLVTSVILISLMLRKRLFEDFGYFISLLSCRVVVVGITVPLLFFRKQLGISVNFAYSTYFFTYWLGFCCEMLLQVLTIYAVYRLAMRGLEGLQRIGQIIFRWIAGVSFGLSVFFAIGPRMGSSYTDYVTVLTGQIHQGISVLTLCLLLFVCLAIRPLGLTFRSHIFGVSLGLGVSAATQLVQSAWFSTSAAHNMYSRFFLVGAIASWVALCIWIAYFALPEPARRMVLLPTTSPFFMWNSISEALGDEPGFVAVSGFKPDMLSEAELEELSRSGKEAREDSKAGRNDDDDGTPAQRNLNLPGYVAG